MKWKFLKNKKKNVEITKPQKSEKSWFGENINTCISCGREIPEGILVCMECERGAQISKCIICDRLLQINEDLICDRCMTALLRLRNKKE